MVNTQSRVASPPAEGNACTGPMFIVLEGLGAVGKSTVAPLLAGAVGADLLDTLSPELAEVRRHVDAQRSVEARLHFWLMANYLASDVVRAALESGRGVVMESYFHRAIATHTALGVRRLPAIDWDHALVPHAVIELRLADDVRQQRLAARARDGDRGYWSALEERNVAAIRRSYDSFNLTKVDATGLSPSQIVAEIERLVGTAAVLHA